MNASLPAMVDQERQPQGHLVSAAMENVTLRICLVQGHNVDFFLIICIT